MGFVVLPLKSVASRGRRQRVICCVDGNGRWRLEVATAVETVRAASRVCLEVRERNLNKKHIAFLCIVVSVPVIIVRDLSIPFIGEDREDEWVGSAQ